MVASSKLLSAEEALQIITQSAPPSPTEIVGLSRAAGRILRQPVFADRDFPPFDRVTMDGIAIAYAAFAQGNRQFRIAHTVMAGSVPPPLTHPTECVEIMTGAPLPHGADTVVRYEDLALHGSIAVIKPEATVVPQQNVHRRASDATAQSLLINTGCMLTASQIAVAAACGYHTLAVSRLPKTAIVSTGDELVPIETHPEPHQIRQSNMYMLAAQLLPYGIEAEMIHVADQPQTIIDTLMPLLEQCELIILSGGVSAGKADYIPTLLKEAGIEILFHGVQQKPGKPLLFGKSHRTTVFGLPGNPVSAFMCMKRYVTTWLQKYLLQNAPLPTYACLAANVSSPPALTYFLPVQSFTDQHGKVWAVPQAGSGSGDFVNLLAANAFLVLPPSQTPFQKGETFALLPF